jgi:hypothetical protein
MTEEEKKLKFQAQMEKIERLNLEQATKNPQSQAVNFNFFDNAKLDVERDFMLNDNSQNKSSADDSSTGKTTNQSLNLTNNNNSINALPSMDMGDFDINNSPMGLLFEKASKRSLQGMFKNYRDEGTTTNTESDFISDAVEAIPTTGEVYIDGKPYTNNNESPESKRRRFADEL